MALAPLSPFVAALVALGLATLLTLLVLALVSFLSNAPVIGGWVAGKAQALEQTISHALGEAFSGIDAFIGGTFHQLARYIEHAGSAIDNTALSALRVAEHLLGISAALHGIRALAHAFTRALHGIEHGIRTLEKEWHGIERRVKSLERDIARGIGHDLRIQVKALEQDVTKIEHRVIPAIEAADAQAAKAISDLWKWVHANVIPVGTTAFEGAVAIALTGLGLGALRCPGFLRLLSKRGCGLGGLLDGLLGLVISALALENVCRLLPFLETAFGDVVGPVTHLLTEVPLGDCEKPPDEWATLSVDVGPLPPPQTLGPLPA